MHVLQRGEEPDLVSLQRSAERAYIDSGAKTAAWDSARDSQSGNRAFSAARARRTPPLPCHSFVAALGRDDDRSRGCAAGVGVFVRRAHGKFLNRVGRKILQKAANPVVGIVAAIDREIVIQARTSAGGNRSDARLGGIGRFDRLGARREIGDVGEAARGERQRLQILAADDSLMHHADQIDGLGRDRGGLRCAR